MNISTRIEPISPIGFLDMLQSIHVAKLLEACDQSSDDWSGDSDITWLVDNPLPEPNAGPKLELPWASDCWGRILYHFHSWDATTWSLEESGVLVAPIYLDGQQAHLVKATSAPPSSMIGMAHCWAWVAELKAHCHMLKICRGVLHVCHAAAVDRGAIAMAYEFEFTPQEIDHLWELLLTLRKSYRVPPRPSNAPTVLGQP